MDFSWKQIEGNFLWIFKYVANFLQFSTNLVEKLPVNFLMTLSAKYVVAALPTKFPTE